MKALARWRSYSLCCQIYCQLVTRLGVDFFKQLRHLFGFQRQRQHAILEAVIKEDVGEARRDDAAESIIQQRPRRVFSGRPAAEIVARQQDRSALVAWLIEEEASVASSISAVAPIGEQAFA